MLTLQNKLTDNVEDIKKVLIHLGFLEDKIRYHSHKNMITSPRPEEGADNPQGFILYTNSLKYLYTTRSGDGNIFTLVMDIKSANFAHSLELICKWLDIKDAKYDIKLPFCGFYKQIIKYKDGEDFDFYKYKSSDLPPDDSLSQKFFLDGISFKVQEKWGIRYEHSDDNILIPIKNYTGELIGCKARSNAEDCPHDKRWFAYLSYPKTSVVYGYYENYRAIQRKNTVVVFEAEKSVLQCASFGLNIAVAIGGHNISTMQAKYILSLKAERIIVAFDTDIVEDELIYECRKLQSKGLLKNKVGYIYDKTHELLGDKMSPSDRGKNIFKKLLNNNVIYLEENDG